MADIAITAPKYSEPIPPALSATATPIQNGMPGRARVVAALERQLAHILLVRKPGEGGIMRAVTITTNESIDMPVWHHIYCERCIIAVRAITIGLIDVTPGSVVYSTIKATSDTDASGNEQRIPFASNLAFTKKADEASLVVLDIAIGQGDETNDKTTAGAGGVETVTLEIDVAGGDVKLFGVEFLPYNSRTVEL